MHSTLIFLTLVAALALVSAIPSELNADVVRRDATLAKKSTAGAIYRRALNREALLGESRIVRRKEDEDEEDEDDKGDEGEHGSSSHKRRDLDDIFDGALDGIFDGIFDGILKH